MNKGSIEIVAELVERLSPQQAWHYHILVKSASPGQLELYISDKYCSVGIANELQMVLGVEVIIEKTDDLIVQTALFNYYKKQSADTRITSLIYSGNQEEFMHRLISEARNLKSSDIHIESYESICRIRLRIDGQLVERFRIEKSEYPGIVNKIKILSSLDISEKRLPQDGRIFFKDGDSKFDIRVSILPTLHGEKVVLRLLNNDATEIDLFKLGMSEVDLSNYLEAVNRPNGLLLISGPTGSGKTTTLYATLKLLNNDTRNITTIEDPIEYTLEGINQVQLRENIGFTFPAALRNFLRQDPNIIMVGEIRDTETANMAIRASLTGHLVLSTIHTNSAWGTVSRLIDMNIPAFLVADTLNTTIAQRLVRALCPLCKQRTELDPSLFPRQFTPFKKVSFHHIAVGCDKCFSTGYRGRRAVYEVIPIDEVLAAQIKNHNYNISGLLKERGIQTLAENAFDLFIAGETSLDEISALLYNN